MGLTFFIGGIQLIKGTKQKEKFQTPDPLKFLAQ